MSGAWQEYQALQAQVVPSEKGGSKHSREQTSIEGFSSDDDDGHDDGSPTKGSAESNLNGTPRRSPPRAGEHAAIERATSRRPWRRFCTWLVPSKRACIIISVVLAIVLSAALGGGAWVYKSAPKDGLSPPWYPTPLGGTVKSWEASYEKARQMVGKMSLAEKVNITTGIGYVCPGPLRGQAHVSG
jgi:beta-glucosidase